MTIFDWIPAGALAAILFLFRNLILTRLRASVQHEFEQKIEGLRSELRSKESAINGIRESLLQATGTHQQAIDARRLQAIDDIWKGMLTLRSAGAGAAPFLALLKLDKICEKLDDPKMLVFLNGVFASTPELGKVVVDVDYKGAERARPWVSSMVWAVFSAYQTIVAYTVSQVSALKAGEDPREYFSDARIGEMLDLAMEGTALPKLTPFSNFRLSEILTALESRLIDELRVSASGVSADEASAERAKRVIKLASDVARDSAKSQGQNAVRTDWEQ